MFLRVDCRRRNYVIALGTRIFTKIATSVVWRSASQTSIYFCFGRFCPGASNVVGSQRFRVKRLICAQLLISPLQSIHRLSVVVALFDVWWQLNILVNELKPVFCAKKLVIKVRVPLLEQTSFLSHFRTNSAGVGNLRPAWTFDMARNRIIFVTHVRVQHRGKTKLHDRQVQIVIQKKPLFLIVR